jgi:Ca2+-binding RTX toxin-like protein
LIAGEGNDRIYGLGGSDILEGGSGNDYLAEIGGAATRHPRFVGGTGNDVLRGSHGNDFSAEGRAVTRLKAMHATTLSSRFDRPATRDRIDCGAGKHDVAYVDRLDVTTGRERVVTK